MRALGRDIAGDLSREALATLSPGERFRLTVAGRSMRPALVEGDELVAVRTADSGRWRLGDVLVLDLPDAGLVVHRLLWISRATVRTRGDGSGRMDTATPRERVIGRVVEARRNGRDVTEAAVVRRIAWARQFVAAVAHRLWRKASGRERPE